mmetsp:Transcript_16984/g.34346  ORF Transcript_16984/g.34346 Transcript_16984/m.34346 type:complete len:82 (+) Transcript_16984:494-739(+)
MHEAQGKGEMDGQTEQGRAALRDLFTKHGVASPHVLTASGRLQTSIIKCGRRTFQNIEQHCSRCEHSVIIDQKELYPLNGF